MFKIEKILQADYIAFMCFFMALRTNRKHFYLYCINWLIFINEVESVYCAVNTESLYDTDTIRL